MRVKMGGRKGATVVDRLSPEDVAALYLEEPTAPMHVGSVSIFQESECSLDYDRLVRLLTERIAMAPRYRQRLKWVPGNLGAPVWVDDTSFDITFHVRRSALPRPGTDAQLQELVARIMARPLDRSKPLWEMYLVEGIKGRRFALLTKSHHALVDGVTSVDISQVILDDAARDDFALEQMWRPAREPSKVSLVLSAAGEQVRSPADAVATVRRSVTDVTTAVTGVGRSALALVSAAMSVARSPAHGPLNFEVSAQRRFAMAALRLSDFKAVRAAHGGTVNDVVLAVVAGAMRTWLLGRGEPLTTRTEITALVPVSVEPSHDREHAGDVHPFLVHLPVGEADPVVRLSRISYEMGRHRESQRLVGAETLSAIAGFAPPTLHALGTRLGADISLRTYNLVVTNVPGPQTALYVGQCEMIAAYPVVALTRGHGLSMGLTSYNGGVFFGLNADRDGVADVTDLALALKTSMTELKDTIRGRRRTRTTRKPQT